ncbi:MAG: UDP-N-acetylglucosamine 2-epimerase [bacterium]
MRTILVITGTRAEYGLLYPLMKEIQREKSLSLQIMVTGMHLSREFGFTYKDIKHDGFVIDKKINLRLASDKPEGISRSMGYGLMKFSKAYKLLCPDIIVVLGDRFEIFSAVAAAMISRIPVAHIGGGDSSEGSIDEAIRSSITKMSHLHFTITKDHRNRVIQLGEDPKRVFAVGALSIDNIKNRKRMDVYAFQKKLKFKLGTKNILVTFHPCTLEQATSKKQFNNLLEAIDELDETHIIFTKPNADADGRIIIKMIDSYVAENKHKAVSLSSMGMSFYLSALQFVDGVVGNSSSGILEAPSFHIGTINIGDRQRGRLKACSIIDCSPTADSIRKALRKMYSKEFQNVIKNTVNPFGEGGASIKIKQILKNYDLKEILKKQFYSIEFKNKELQGGKIISS